ncbi:MAG: hypothetical protein H7288_01995 [Kineosporiaceae bacterium]|nr:hypothetical protein [Aeromicrobium sp.]
MSAERAETRALRGQMREWRNGRAEKTLWEAMSDAYIALFATLMLGATSFNVVRQVRVEATAACSTTACSDARSVLPWIFALGIVTVAVFLARLFGPSLVSPAEGSWLLAAPVDRKALLRPRLVVAAALSLIIGALLGAVDTTLGGFGVGPAVTITILIAAAAVCGAMFAAIDQAYELRLARPLTWALGAVVWAGLLQLALGRGPSRMPQTQQLGPAVVVIAVALLLLAVALIWRAIAGLALIRRDQLTTGGSLLANLSGAFFSLDTLLIYDLLLSRRWHARATVKPVRGGPGGAWALIWRDVVRLRRSVHTVLLLAASLVVPYVAATIGLGKAVTLVGALTGFLAGLGLCAGLRVLARTPGLIRCFPMSAPVVRAAGLAVPAAVLIAWGAATIPAVHHGLAPVSWPASMAVGLAVGMASVAAVARWIMAAPPDYSAPLVSTASGAIPPSLFGNLFRGLDVLLLVTVPMLLASPMTGAVISIGLATIVLVVILNIRRGVTHSG